jgi:hypothetical protein
MAFPSIHIMPQIKDSARHSSLSGCTDKSISANYLFQSRLCLSGKHILPFPNLSRIILGWYRREELVMFEKSKYSRSRDKL